ncbi:MAG: hypothetical protein KDA33_12375 [Phycisphaerales bacterium]|nr:hypothetical protein [Phycisphaerales bacterium]
MSTSASDESSAAPSADENGAPRGAVTGACCYGESTCDITTELGCLTEGLRWLGPDTTCADCPLLSGCPGDSLFAQRPANPFQFQSAGVSEQSAGTRFYERFSGLVGPITKVTFWGFDLGIPPSGQFDECVETDNTFQISFHPDLGNRPAEAICDYTLTATRTPTGVYYIDGFELNEYEVILPQPCVLTRGWISILGLGDPLCNFVWAPTRSAGDNFSVCSGCVEVEQSIDLAVCIRGTYSGVFGACCDDAVGACTDNVEIVNCLGPSQRFAPDTLCSDLSPACGVEIGACCGNDQTRALTCEDGVLEADCQGPNETYVPNGVCQFVQATCGAPEGGCCMGYSLCVELTQAECVDEGWNWIGAGTACAECPPPPTCPSNTLFAQPLADYIDRTPAYTSENSRGAVVYDDFEGVNGVITHVRFYGFDLQPISPTAFIECEESLPDFEIKFYEDQGGGPGPIVSSQFIPALRTPTGIVYYESEVNEYEVELIEPVAMTRGWISIVGYGDPTCYFLWSYSSATGGGSVREITDYPRPFRHDADFAFCLLGSPGGAFGACCNQQNGACTNNTPIENCVGPDDRFVANETCLAAIADCGVPKGACCLNELACQFITSADCSSLSGVFLGVDSSCIECGCKVFCDPMGISEGEPDCSAGFVDVTNYGCDQASPIFTPMIPGEVHCGTTGINFDGENIIVDVDWYQVELTEASDFSYRFESESPAQALFLDATNGCPGFLIDGATVDACSPVNIFLFLNPGVYWVRIEPIGPSDASACGAAYKLTPLNAPCEGDFDFDRDVDMLDFALLQTQFGMTGVGLFGDLNSDGVVDIADIHLFEAELGNVCP